MKKLLLSIFAIGLVSLVAFGATRAYFSDQEQILGNTITTGKVDIDLRNTASSTFHLTGLMPGIWTQPMELDIYNLSDSHPVKYRITDRFVSDTIPNFYNMINVTVRHTNAGTSNPEEWPVVFTGKLGDLSLYSSSSISEILGTNITHVYYLQFQLDPSTNNTYMGGTATFDILVDAIQQEATW